MTNHENNLPYCKVCIQYLCIKCNILLFKSA